MNTILNLYYESFKNSLRIKKRLIRKNFNKNIYVINYLLDESENKICGFCIHLYIPIINAIQIDYIAIDKNYQGMGLAKMLFNHIFENYCLEKILTLECESHLIGFYKKLGCQYIPIPYKPGCESCLSIMVKSNKKINLLCSRIVNTIKLMNDYSGNHIFQKKILANIVQIKPQKVLNKYLVMNEVLPYNNFTKEGIS